MNIRETQWPPDWMDDPAAEPFDFLAGNVTETAYAQPGFGIEIGWNRPPVDLLTDPTRLERAS